MPFSPAETPEDLASPSDILAVSGLDFMRAVAAGDIAGPPICRTMNFWIESVEDGQVVFRGKPQFGAMNPIGSLHGGWYGTVLDSCMACAVMTKVPKGKVYTTLEYRVNIIRAIPLGCDVLAVGRVQHSGRSTGVAQGEILGAEDGKLYATGSTTCMIMAPGR